jgi:hypothetical protein
MSAGDVLKSVGTHLLEGLSSGFRAHQDRQQQLKMAALDASMQMYAKIMGEAAPEARGDILHASLEAMKSVVSPNQFQKQQGKGCKNAPPDPISVLEQGLLPILNKRYPDSSPEQKADFGATGLPESIRKIQVTTTHGAFPTEEEKETEKLRAEQRESEQKFQQQQAQVARARQADLQGLLTSPGFLWLKDHDPAKAQAMLVAQAENEYHAKPEAQSEVSWQRVHIQDEKGVWMPGQYNPKTKEYTTIDGKPLGFTPKDVVTGEPSAEKADKDVAEVVELAKGHEAEGMKPDDALKQARKDYLKKFQTTEQGKEARTDEAQERLKKLKDQIIGEGAETISAMADKYKPGGKSVANPQGSDTIEGLAWQWLTTGHMTYLGMGKSPERNRAIARSIEILKDAGLDMQDLEPIRANVKADTGALSKITSYGTQIGQFEGTLTRNADLAKRISKDFPRFDSKLANEVYEAFKVEGAGDAQANNLAAQLHGLADEWGKLLAGSTGTAGVAKAQAQATNDILAALGNHSLDSLIENVIKPDAANRSNAVLQQRQKLMQGLRDAVSKPGVTLGEPAPAGTAVAGGDQQKDMAPSGKPYIGTAKGPNGHIIRTDGLKWYDPTTGKVVQ